jgi:hypothetical protein
MKLFAVPSVIKKTWKRRCPSLPSREAIVSLEPAVLPVVEAVHPETVPVATKFVAGDQCQGTGKNLLIEQAIQEHPILFWGSLDPRHPSPHRYGNKNH